jgi:CheY-like chemotaxis protein
VICKRLAEAMGGKVWATSQVGEGSSFFTRIQVVAFTELEKATPGHIPLIMAKPESETAVSKLSKALGEGMPLKIAVAEDNRANQRVLMIMLRRMGWEAVFTENGEELIDHLKDNLCDLIFMDLQMPSMDGLEATALIRAGAAGEVMKDVKIIALTANALISDEARCFEVGMDAYLSKPLKLDLLKKKIVSLFPVEESDLTIA